MKGIIAVSGLPGVGKSFFARHLAEKLKAAYLSTDTLRKEIIPSRTYSEKEKTLVYNELVNRINALEDKDWIVVDATFHKNENRARVEEIAQKKGVRLFWIKVTASEETIRERVSKPRPDSDANFAVYQKIKEAFEDFQTPVLILNSDHQSVDSMIWESLIYTGNERG
ncbi:MAG TPA: AAA family ATPase [Cytophagaceae bacterium]